MAATNGTVQRLYLLQVATGTIPLPAGQTLIWPIVCYLVATSDGKHVLIDSGHPADFQPQAGMPPLTEGRNVVQQLADLNLQPDDIHFLVCTHFDVDHAGYLDAFPNAELIVQRSHYDVARSGHPRYAPARAHWDHPALRYRLIEGDAEPVPGIMLVETSGHAPGHQSVLVRLPQTGPVLLTIDAVPLERLFTPERRATPTDDDEEQVRASTRKLLDLVEREHVNKVIYGHDGEQWQRLHTAPRWYE